MAKKKVGRPRKAGAGRKRQQGGNFLKKLKGIANKVDRGLKKANVLGKINKTLENTGLAAPLRDLAGKTKIGSALTTAFDAGVQKGYGMRSRTLRIKH
jgi:hypothetical protein